MARSPSLSAAGKREERDSEIEAERETEKGKLKQKQGPNWTQSSHLGNAGRGTKWGRE